MPQIRFRRGWTAPLLAAAAASALVLAACSATPSSTPAESSAGGGGEGTSVTITAVNAFGVAEITVAAGDTVTFVNNSTVPHTVTEGEGGRAADNARFDDQLAVGASDEVTFDEAGDYNVTCKIHGAAGMNMVVHVE